MTLAPRLRRYLEHFGPTVSVADFLGREGEQNLVALRHDVDYDLDIALEMAFWEHRLGHRATYFVLHTAGYWDDPRLLDKCLQIQDFGHEIGLHTNLVTQWYRGEIADVGERLGSLLEKFRGAGLDVRGVAAHGDALCYEVGFTNYWLFEELRPDDPAAAEASVTAEGTGTRQRRAISYPKAGDELKRPDGATLDYWSLRLSDFGLSYEGSRVKADHYYSDSGGDWKRSPDPLNSDLSRGRNLVLMHPIYWRDRRRHYYFLSTARSGSRWLANFLDTATSVIARHEFTLNHTFKSGQPIASKRTGAGFSELRASTSEVDWLIREARNWSENLKRDYAEANIYLEQFIDRLPHDEDTLYVHLHRHPAAVVRSLLQRNWYAIPFDHNHPQVGRSDWHQLSQLEQACWYVRDVNERLAAACSATLAFEDMIGDFDCLTGQLEKLGIAVYPRLARPIFDRPINSTSNWDVQPVSAWSERDQEVFSRICGPLMERLGYEKPPSTPRRCWKTKLRALIAAFVPTLSHSGSKEAVRLPNVEPLANLDTISQTGALAVKNCTLVRDGARPSIQFFAWESSYVMLGGGFFHGAKEAPGVDTRSSAGSPRLGGWAVSPGKLYTVALELGFTTGDASLRLFCLSYDGAGQLLDQREIGIVAPSFRKLVHHFRPSRHAQFFNLALFKASGQGAVEVHIKQFQLAAHAETRSAAMSPEQALDRAPHLADSRRGRSLIKNIADLMKVLRPLAQAPIAPWHSVVRIEKGELLITPSDAARHANFLAAGGTWNLAKTTPKTASMAGPVCAWNVGAGERLSGYVRGTPLRAPDHLAVCVLSYDQNGELLENLRVGTISERQESVSFTHVLPDRTSFCNLGFALPAGSGGLLLSEIEVAASRNPSPNGKNAR